MADLARLLPERGLGYPDLPVPTEDELTAKVRLFEAVARLLDALAERAPLVLLLDDLQWVDEASLDLVRYLARDWIRHDNRVLLLGTLRCEGLEPKSQLADLGRDLPLSQVPLQPLSQAQTLQLIEALAGQEHTPACSSRAVPAQEPERPLVALAGFLFEPTGGHPLYLLEALRSLGYRVWLGARLGAA